MGIAIDVFLGLRRGRSTNMKILELAFFAAVMHQCNGVKAPLCHAKGECQGHLIDFKACHGIAECLYYCKADVNCNWWTWDDPKELCLLFEDCEGEDSPTGERCEECISGQR